MERNLFTDKKSSRTKKNLKESFLELSNSVSPENLTIQALLEHADCSRGAFYKHYKNKTDFYENILNEAATSYALKSCDMLINYSSDYEKSVRKSSLLLFNHIYKNQQIYTLIFNNQLFPDSKERFFNLVNEKVLPYYENSLYKIDTFVDAKLYIYAINKWFFIFLTWWIQNNFNITPEELFEQENAVRYQRLVLK